MEKESEFVKWGLGSVYVFIALSVMGLISYLIGFFLKKPFLYEYPLFGLLNIAWMIFIFFFYSHTIGFTRVMAFIFSWVLGAAAWFLAGSLLAYLSKNKKSKKQKQRYNGKIIMIVSVIALAIIFVPVWLAVMYYPEGTRGIENSSFRFAMPLFGTLFLIGLLLWLNSKYRIKEVS